MKITPILSLAVAATLVGGCASSTRYVESNNTQKMVANVGEINIQDWNSAADTMVNSLIDSVVNANKLQAGSGNPEAILAISRIVNSTTEQIDTSLLTKKIRIALNKTGKVLTTTTDGFGGAEDPLAKGNKQEAEFYADKKTSTTPDYTLSGKIIEDRSRQGSLRQSAYVFQLSLTDKRGLAIWEDEKTIVKQSRRSNVGF